MQDLHDAFRVAAAGYPGGMAALAQRLDISYEVLRKQVARAQGFKLGADTLCLASQLCVEAGSPNCNAIVNAFNGSSGGFLKLEVREAGPSLLDATVGLMQDSTAVLGAVTAARSDGVISDNERRIIERHASTVISDMQAVLAEVARENEACHLREVK